MEIKPQLNLPSLAKYELEKFAITVGLTVYEFYRLKNPDLIDDKKIPND